ncbi:TPA: AbrB/MazE/SpoVT family DNA-binding domain-containing protein [Candidatus Bathyarchaeota archaeon]|nr:AbrB/MazE/SpoVT family DNA-binding domain-containing protein [Candidatus Bathyarchaeota archaeon]
MDESTVITKKGQFKLLESMIKKYALKPGDKIKFIERDEGVLLVPLTKAHPDHE